MGKPKKRRTSAKKRKGSVVVRQKASVRPKRKKSGNNDTLPKAPFIMNDNGLNMRIKIKRKSR